jgi:two-component system, LytTR family, response regulator
MKKLRAIIVDDEENARFLLKSYLADYPDIEVVAECCDGFEGAIAAKQFLPDLIFLDIQMPRLTGFEMLELLEEIPMIIFSTAFDEFAIKAFEYGAVDYLLKPFSSLRFEKAIEKVMNRSMLKNDEPVKKIVDFVQNHQETIHRIAVKKNNLLSILPSSSIRHIEAQDDFVFIYTIQGERFTKNLTMKYLEDHLDSKEFIRVHRSHMIRIDQVGGIELFEKDSHLLRLKDGKTISMSKSGYKKLKDLLKM